jgi:hypothetical protein
VGKCAEELRYLFGFALRAEDAFIAIPHQYFEFVTALFAEVLEHRHEGLLSALYTV